MKKKKQDSDMAEDPEKVKQSLEKEQRGTDSDGGLPQTEKEVKSQEPEEEADTLTKVRLLLDTILTVEAKSVRYTPEYEFKKESQIVTQDVDSTSTDKNSFIVKFEKAFYSDIPKIYSTMTSTSFISCTAIDDNKSLKCIPDSNTMIDGNSYKIVYQKACDGDKVETGITINYSNSNYMKYTGIFIILGLFLY